MHGLSNTDAWRAAHASFLDLVFPSLTVQSRTISATTSGRTNRASLFRVDDPVGKNLPAFLDHALNRQQAAGNP